jgi:hypothetical protein
LASAKLARAAQQVLAQNRRGAIRMAQVKGVGVTREVLAAAARDLKKRIMKAEGLRGPGADSFTAVQMRAALRQVEQVTRDVAVGIRRNVLAVAGDAAEDAAGDTIEYMAKADAAFRGVGQPLALREALVMDRAQLGVRSSVLRRLVEGPEEGMSEGPTTARMGILQRYGVETVGTFEKILQRGLLARKSWADMREDVTEASPFLRGAPAHWAARIVRTEVMGAYGKASWESVREADEQLGDMVKILSATFDLRTGADSYAVHGQIRRPDEPFESWYGYYMHPPNRPNDREIVVPHRISWELPEYLQWRDGAEVYARWRALGNKRAMPDRPEMTTVDLSLFGREDEALEGGSKEPKGSLGAGGEVDEGGEG